LVALPDGRRQPGYRDLTQDNKQRNGERDFSMRGMVLGVGFAF
jgi:hypothetical protein